MKRFRLDPPPALEEIKPPYEGKLFTVGQGPPAPAKQQAIVREIHRRMQNERRELREQMVLEIEQAVEEAAGQTPTVLVSGMDVLGAEASTGDDATGSGQTGASSQQHIRADVAELHNRVWQLQEQRAEILWLLEQVQILEQQQKDAARD